MPEENTLPKSLKVSTKPCKDTPGSKLNSNNPLHFTKNTPTFVPRFQQNDADNKLNSETFSTKDISRDGAVGSSSGS